MGNRPLALLSGITLSLGLAVFSLVAKADDGATTRSGILRCGGTNNVRLSGTEMQLTFWDVRNLSSTTPVSIDRVTIFDAAGNVLFDSRISGTPSFQGGVSLGPTNNVLGPNQTTELVSSSVLPFLSTAQIPIQVEFVWSAPDRVPPLDIRAIRLSRERDPISGALLADRARSDFNCVSIG